MDPTALLLAVVTLLLDPDTPDEQRRRNVARFVNGLPDGDVRALAAVACLNVAAGLQDIAVEYELPPERLLQQVALRAAEVAP